MFSVSMIYNFKGVIQKTGTHHCVPATPNPVAKFPKLRWRVMCLPQTNLTEYRHHLWSR